jgi:outer membrane protein assembly factor BamD
MKHGFYAFVAILVLALAGCPSVWQAANPDKPTSAEELFKKAENQYANKDYKQALESYERLKSAFPDFKRLPHAYMRIGDCLFNQNNYEQAIARYLQFIELYPAHQEASRAKFNVAMSYFNQIKGTDLDNSVVKRAADSFKKLVDDPNAGEWAKKAEEKHRECLRKLAEKELYVAEQYWNMGKYKSAHAAAKRVLEEYPKLGFEARAREIEQKTKDK